MDELIERNTQESDMDRAQQRWTAEEVEILAAYNGRPHEALEQWRQAVRAMEAADAAMNKEGKQ